MKGLREKFQSKKGFTLVEMLIVVAIIAILIAISIPLINSALERARDSTDAANERAAKAEALVIFMGVVDDKDPLNNVKITTDKGDVVAGTPPAADDEEDGGSEEEPETETKLSAAAGVAFTAFYDAVNGCLTTGDIAPYGKCTGCDSDYAKTEAAGGDNHVTKVIVVEVDSKGIVELSWEDPTTHTLKVPTT